MKMLSGDGVLAGRRRWSLTAFVVVALAFLAAGLLFSGGIRAERVARGRPAVLASGEFSSIAWPTTGRAVIVRKADGCLKLLLRNLNTQEAPELDILLAPTNGSGQQSRKIAGLRSPTGNQVYSLPADAARNLHLAVIIWCPTCRKAWGSAHLHVMSRHARPIS